MNIHKQHSSNVKLSGLESGLDLDADKIKTDIHPFQQQLEAEELKRALQNRQFDPNYMEINLPDSFDTGSVSFDPNDVTFNF